MKLKNLIGLIILISVGYFGYTFLVTNFSSEAMVYKRYAEALLESEPTKVKPLMDPEGNAMEAFSANKERKDFLNGDVRFTWYEFKDKKVSPDGNFVTLTVVQNVRVDPPGADTFYGTEVRRDRHVVELRKHQSTWRIVSFGDTATMQHQAQNAKR